MADEKETVIFECPHCGQLGVVLEKEINCSIFRHAAYIENSQPIDPHASKEVCEQLLADGLIHGCGKPFKLVKADETEDSPGGWMAEVCDYI